MNEARRGEVWDIVKGGDNGMAWAWAWAWALSWVVEGWLFVRGWGVEGRG